MDDLKMIKKIAPRVQRHHFGDRFAHGQNDAIPIKPDKEREYAVKLFGAKREISCVHTTLQVEFFLNNVPILSCGEYWFNLMAIF
jgi:hypothetical protein